MVNSFCFNKTFILLRNENSWDINYVEKILIIS